MLNVCSKVPKRPLPPLSLFSLCSLCSLTLPCSARASSSSLASSVCTSLTHRRSSSFGRTNILPDRSSALIASPRATPAQLIRFWKYAQGSRPSQRERACSVPRETTTTWSWE